MSDDRARPGLWIWLVSGLILAILVVALIIWGQPLYEFAADQERIRAWVRRFGPWGPLALAALEMAQVLLAPVPGQAIEAVGGYLFGPWVGTLYAMLGIGVGSLLNFALARRFGRPWVARQISSRSLSRFDDLSRRGGTLFFFLIWLFPFVPDDLACLAAGLTPMPIRQFLLLMFLGRLPGILVSTWLGSNAARISPVWWVVLLILVSVAALVVWRWGEAAQRAVVRFLQNLAVRLGR
jgi:uncharacterized membrane protein YdjX (TVP38/TMEM64 family)